MRFTVHLEFFSKIDHFKSSFENVFYWPTLLVGRVLLRRRWGWQRLQHILYNVVPSKLWALTFLRLLTLYKLWTKNEAYF